MSADRVLSPECVPDNINGVLNINKPAGITSMDVVRQVKRVCGQRRVGHAGTLDPFATGVIPICLGQATRMMEYLINGTKEYTAVVELGVETDTYDVEGSVSKRVDASGITRQEVESSLENFVGEIYQIPPMYSALKIGGKRLYEMARQGKKVERKPRVVRVDKISVTNWDLPRLEIDVVCGRGFYMRSLAHDLGRVLNCGGHLVNLMRLRNGPLTISKAITVGNAVTSFELDQWQHALYPVDIAVGHLRTIIVNDEMEFMVRNGRYLPSESLISDAHIGEQCRVYNSRGLFIGIVVFDFDMGVWKPYKVFNLPDK